MQKAPGMSCLHFQNGKTHPDALSGLQPLNLRMIIYNLRSFQNLALRKLLLPGRRRYPAVRTVPLHCLRLQNRRTGYGSLLLWLRHRFLACSDRPDRLISDNRCLSLIRSYSKESNLNLLTDEIHGHALLSLL